MLPFLQEPGTMDSVRSGPFGQIFRPDNFIFGQVSSFCLSQHVWQLTPQTSRSQRPKCLQ